MTPHLNDIAHTNNTCDIFKTKYLNDISHKKFELLTMVHPKQTLVFLDCIILQQSFLTETDIPHKGCNLWAM